MSKPKNDILDGDGGWRGGEVEESGGLLALLIIVVRDEVNLSRYCSLRHEAFAYSEKYPGLNYIQNVILN